MQYIGYKNNRLYVEDVDIIKLIKRYKTPLYVYSKSILTKNFLEYKKAIGKRGTICYAVKANSNINILKLLGRLGSGADIVSIGELYRAELAKIPPDRIVFSGVGKTDKEIKYAILKGILMINVESEEELKRVGKIASKLGICANISIRVNPDVDPKTHPNISTGLKKNKFGIDSTKVIDLYKMAKDNKFLSIKGISCHIGSQILSLNPIKEAAIKVKEIVKELESLGIEIKYIDMGGGLGIKYNNEEPPSISEHVKAILDVFNEDRYHILLEPGRAIVGNAGLLITQILYIKRQNNKIFYIVDAGMNDLMRPAIYGAYHEIITVVRRNNKKIIADIVGPICESTDCFAKDREIEELKSGNYIAILSAGAYGFSMSSNYNSRPRCPEVLVEDDSYELIRKRESYYNLMKNELI